MSAVSEKSIQDIDTRLLSNFIHEFNIARRHITAYPGHHPIITTSLGKVLSLLKELLSLRNEITLGAAKDALLLGDSYLDKTNPVFRDLSRLLFGQGVATITFKAHLTIEELLNFYHLLSMKRESIDKEGGIAQVLSNRAITGIHVVPIDYSAFRATEGETLEGKDDLLFKSQSLLLWESFVRSVLEGTLADKNALSGKSMNLDPSVLADILNKARSRSAGDAQIKSYDQGIADFLKQLTGKDLTSVNKEELLLRLTGFITQLDPGLRRQFLNSSFAALETNTELTQPLLSGIPEQAILETLEEMNSRKAPMSQTLLGLIGKLSQNISVKIDQFSATKAMEDDLKQKLKVIFQEDSLDKFMPENYQKDIQTILSSITISMGDLAELETLKRTLVSHDIEGQISLIILDMINNFSADCDPELMQKNLLDLCNYFLSMGDFTALVKIYESMCRCNENRLSERCSLVNEAFSSADFIEEVLNGLTFWGKSKYPEIERLIDCVGTPFANPLLDRLAEEQNMSLRRFYIDRLTAIGTTARDAAILRLRDNRWYFVRNVIVILRTMGDASAVPHLKRLTVHPHPKVRHETLMALLEFQDPEADKLLIRDLASADRETQISAVRLAEHCKNTGVLRILLELLEKGGLKGFDFELKSAAIHALGMIGNPAALPELERFLKSRSILRAGQLNRLKLELVQSLKHYPKNEAIDFLKKISGSGNRDVRKSAEELYRSLQGGERAN